MTILLSSIAWFVGACITFSVIVVILFKGNFVSESRNEAGRLKKKQSKKGLLGILGFAILVCGFLFFYSFFVFKEQQTSFWKILLVNFLMLLALTTYDTLVIDLLVIGIIRPKFLNLPDEMNWEAMIEHAKLTLVKSWIFIIPLSLLPSIIYFFVQ